MTWDYYFLKQTDDRMVPAEIYFDENGKFEFWSHVTPEGSSAEEIERDWEDILETCKKNGVVDLKSVEWDQYGWIKALDNIAKPIVTLQFKSKEDRSEFMSQLSDGWGEPFVSLEWDTTQKFDDCRKFEVELLREDD